MRRLLFVWLPAAVIAVALLLGIAWGALWWWQNQPAQLLAAAVEHYHQAEAAEKANDPATAMKAYLAAEERFVPYFRDGPKPVPTDVLVLRYRTLSRAAVLLATDEAARAAAPGRDPSAIIVAARGAAAQAADADASNPDAQAAMLECCFRDDQLDLAERYARNYLQHATDQHRADPDSRTHFRGAYFASARSALRHTPPQADVALEHLRAIDELEERWTREEFGARPVPPSVRYRWRMTYLEAQALAVKAAPPRLVTGARAVADAQAAGQELESRMAVWFQRVRDEVKTAHADPSASGFAKLSSSDVRGLLDFLTFAVEQARTRAAAVERTETLLTAWDALLLANPSRTAQQELVARLGTLPPVIEQLPAEIRPAPRDWSVVYPRWEAVAARLTKLGAPVEPTSYLTLARVAHKHGDFEAGVRIARSGTKSAETRRLPADTREVLELHAEAAWMCLLRGKSADAEEPLTALGRQTKLFRGLTTYVEAIKALEAGQLDAALARLQQVRQFPDYSKSLYTHLGLARVLLDAGRFDLALASLDRLEQYYLRYENLPTEQQILARRLGLGRPGTSRELFRTHLALGNAEAAARYKEQLREDPDWLGVSLALVGHLLGLAPTRPGASPPTNLDAAKAELTAARRFAPDDPRLLLLEWELRTAQGAEPTAEEEKRYLDSLDSGLRPGDALLARVVWMLGRQRDSEALQTLDRLVKEGPTTVQDRLPALRARCTLAGSRSVREAERLLAEAGLARSRRERALPDLHLAFGDDSPMLSRSESAGLRHYRQALIDHVHGNLEKAARGYLPAVTFAALRTEARRHLLGCLLQLREQDSPAAANALATELLQTRPDEPALLLAFIDTAVLLDYVHGSQGAEGALEGLESVLREQHGDPSSGPYFQARTWLAAGRPDLAARHVERALAAAAPTPETLRLAVAIARARKDWPGCLRHAQALEKAEPGSREALLARAEALAGRGDSAGALAAYEDFYDRAPERPEGCLGPATLLEKAGDSTAALGWVMRRRERSPGDMTALQAEVRLRAELGQMPEESELLPGPAQRGQASESAAILAVGRGLLQGGEPVRALAWARRAETANAGNPEALARARCLLGDVCQALAEGTESTAERKKRIEEAIDHYRAAYRDAPGLIEAGRPLALLLTRERGEADAAYAIVQRLCQGRHSQTMIGGDRLPLELLDTAGVVFLASGHEREAVTLYREAVARYSDEPVVFLRLGQALAAMKRRPDASEALDRAVQLASARAEAAHGIDEKARWLELADEAHKMTR